MNRPYLDDKLFHFGFQLGINFSSFGVTESRDSVPFYNSEDDEIIDRWDTLHARVSGVMPGFHVAFVSDLRLTKYLNLRFCPGMQFTSRTLSYIANSGNAVSSPTGYGKDLDILAIPVYLPLYLKWSAAREGNYRPYVIGGGGVSFNVSRDKEKPILLNVMDYFCEIGFGVDLYFRWFKFCPEITYRIGFGNQLVPTGDRTAGSKYDHFYTDAISRLTSHCVCLTFNFE